MFKVASNAPASTMSPTLTLMLATVPSSVATTGVSIFMISRTKIVSPFFTDAPTEDSILNTFPAAPASILTLPAPPAGAAAFGAAAGS